MEKKINYSGIAAAPSDYTCPDGQLSLAVNLIHEDGALKPVAPPSTLFQLQPGQNVVFIHETPDYRHFIVYDNENLYWRTQDNERLNLFFKLNRKQLYSIESIGNTMMAITSDGVYYFLWSVKAENVSGYDNLGNTIPDIQLSFGLQGNFTIRSLGKFTFEKDFPNPPSGATKIKITDQTLIDQITNFTLAGVNKTISEIMSEDRDDAKFIYPFFVRYAYRMYDGSLIHHSAPILMLPSTFAAPVSNYAGSELELKDDKYYIKSITPDISMYASSLDYKLLNFNNEIESIRSYTDIIKSVDIFVSAPIYSYNQQGKVNTLSRFPRKTESQELNSFFVGKLLNNSEYIDNQKYTLWNICKIDRLIGSFPLADDGWTVDIPLFTEAEIKEKIESAGQFYKIASIPINKILDNTERTKLKIPATTMETIVNQEQMTDDYDSHDVLYPKNSFNYNSRLNLANVNKLLFRGFSPNVQMCFTDEYSVEEIDQDKTWNNIQTKSTSFTGWVYIKTGGKIITVKNEYPYQNINTIPYCFFYPNINAYMAIIKDNTTNKYATITLAPHDLLNGAYWFGNFSKLEFKEGKDPEESDNRSVSLPNQIYTSEVNNPFYFPATGVNTIGTGTILGVTAAVKALSQGQFGQFPLYVFSTDGVWAMSVSDTGVYSTKQPVTRDVCNNPESITQLDASVLFTTERGIMQLSGSETAAITDILIGTPVNLKEIPKIEVLQNMYDIFIDIPELFDFMDYIRKAKIAYDYKGQKIVVFNPYYTYCFVLSLRSGNWTMCTGNYQSTVNSYPDCYVMTTDNRLVNLSEEKSTVMSHSILLTRPFKFDLPDVHKTVVRMIQKGNMANNHIQCVLYGSNDLKNWIVVSSSLNAIIDGYRGTPYKYFRLIAFPMLDKYESLSGFTVDFEPRQTNKIR